MGHVRVYTISDVITRVKKMQGFDVINPMGWDAFGLPAENAAMERNIKPSDWTYSNIEHMKKQLQMLDLDFDWDREVTTCSPDYYRWTQWIFLKLYQKGFAYKKEAFVNWDPVDKTVLANEQVDANGKSWRSGAIVEQKKLDQWFFKIREFASDLLNTSQLDWPDKVKKMQQQWIGESKGVIVDFNVGKETLSIFTTRVETIFGVTFIGISQDHPLNKSGIKSGDTGLKAIHPLTNQEIPVHVCEYVVSDFAQGAVMGVPAHDDRDLTYAKEHNIPIIQVIDEKDTLISSGDFSGLSISNANLSICAKLIMQGCGKPSSEYRLRDWLISRQRNWGCPIPVVYCPTCGVVPLPEKELPVMHDSPIERQCPCGKGVSCKRETDTMDTFVDSSWYFLRYCDPKNSSKIFETELTNKWMNVDVYIGGIEHAVLHLLYARFIHKFLHSLGLVENDEPFKKLLTQGIVQGRTFKNSDGKYFKMEEIVEKENAYFDKHSGEKLEIVWEKMSKSKGNGVNPEEVIAEFGVDVVRLYILFKAPVDKELEWDRDQIVGQQRFLTKFEDLYKKMTVLNKHCDTELSIDETKLEEMNTNISKTINGFLKDMSVYSLNTCISWFHKYLNILNENVLLIQTSEWQQHMDTLITLMYPLTPGFCKKLKPEVVKSEYPQGKMKIKESRNLTIVVAINGKKKGIIKLPREELHELETIIRDHPQFGPKVSNATRVVKNEKIINFIVEKVEKKKE